MSRQMNEKANNFALTRASLRVIHNKIRAKRLRGDADIIQIVIYRSLGSSYFCCWSKTRKSFRLQSISLQAFISTPSCLIGTIIFFALLQAVRWRQKAIYHSFLVYHSCYKEIRVFCFISETIWLVAFICKAVMAVSHTYQSGTHEAWRHWLMLSFTALLRDVNHKVACRTL